MEEFKIRTTSPEETSALAEKLGTLLDAGDVVTLEGDLGAGKTTFTKGLAKGLGVKRVVNSPTFTIIKEYKGRVPFYHMDVYRLEDSDEDLGFEEYFDGEGVTVVEWARFIADRLPEDRLNINISRTGDEDRELKLNPVGERFITLCKELVK